MARVAGMGRLGGRPRRLLAVLMLCSLALVARGLEGGLERGGESGIRPHLGRRLLDEDEGGDAGGDADGGDDEPSPGATPVAAASQPSPAHAMIGLRTITPPGKQPTLDAWIDVDLLPWKQSGITRVMVANAAKLGMRTCRFQIINGKLYGSPKYTTRGPSRIWYAAWGLLDLLAKHGSKVPNVDIVIQVQDDPQVHIRQKSKSARGRVQQYEIGGRNAPPPMFSAVTTAGSYDILWPLWTIWGEDVPGASASKGGFHDPPWDVNFPKIVGAAKSKPWAKRKNKAFWRGSAKTSPLRRTLIACKQRKQIDAATVEHKLGKGKAISAHHRSDHKYIIYMDGKTFSGGMLAMIPAGTVMFIPHSSFYTFYSRPWIAAGHFVRFDRQDKNICANISASVEHMENNPKEAEEMARKGQEWAERELAPSSVYNYMLKMLQAYAKLQRYEPRRMGGQITLSKVKGHVKRKK